MIYRTVTVKPIITGKAVKTSPLLLGRVISVNPEVINKIAYSNMDEYDGDYEVTPLAHEAVVLPTAQKQMRDDVTVFKVPYFETTNEHGTTVYIAEE